MTQKVLKVGSSLAVTIPKKTLEKLGWKAGVRVDVEIDKKGRGVSIMPTEQISKENAKIAKLTLSFIKRYRKDLEALAKE